MILSRCSSKFPLLETTLLHHTHYLRHHRKPRWLETNTVTRYKSIRYIEVVQVIPINRGDVKKRKKKRKGKKISLWNWYSTHKDTSWRIYDEGFLGTSWQGVEPIGWVQVRSVTAKEKKKNLDREIRESETMPKIPRP